jgi:lipopolysaccharide export system protein LptC
VSQQLPSVHDLPAGVKPQRPHTLIGWWDRVSIYVPLLMMGGLALGTYWLVRNTPNAPAAQEVKEVKHEVDYFLRKFSVKSYDDGGRLTSEIYGLEGRHYPDTDVLEIDQARIRNINPAGDIVNATANRAYSNGDGSEIQLTGNAVVVREARGLSAQQTRVVPRLEFQGDFLHVFVNEERVKSDKPVVLTRGTDKFSGDSFEYNNLDGVANLKGRVKGVLMPRAALPPAP